jgi:hypothetical protein
MAKYTYQPLPPGLIRLARILPSQVEEASIQCEITPYVLTDSRRGHHLYEALSYHWGSWEKPCEVLVGSESLPITRNLHAALASPRDESLERVMWIDVICINQEDYGEKASQVEHMGYIYARASRVLVWLNEVTDDLDADVMARDTNTRALKSIRSAIFDMFFYIGITTLDATLNLVWLYTLRDAEGDERRAERYKERSKGIMSTFKTFQSGRKVASVKPHLCLQSLGFIHACAASRADDGRSRAFS